MNPNESEREASEATLESWKEIAAYLQRNAVTVRRWEKDEGLPVHRHSHKRGSSVYAYASEIDAWRVSRKVVPEPPPARPLWKIPAFAVTMGLCLVMVGNGIRPVSAQPSRDGGASFHEVWRLPLKGNLGPGVSGNVSRDGRYLPFVDWSRNGNLFLHDLPTGAERALTTTATDRLPGNHIEQFALETSFSRDSKQIAYSWYRGDTNRFELRLMDLKGGGVPESRLLLDLADNAGITPGDWSPDGKSIAVVILRGDKTGQIGMVSVADGALRVLRSLDWRGTTALAFSPNGKYLAYDLPEADNTEKRDIFVIATDGSREIPVAAGPSEDTVIGWSNDGKQLLFASNRSGSTGLWRIAFSEGKIETTPELVKADIGDVANYGLTDSGKLYTGINPPRGNSVTGDIYLASIDFATGKVLSPPVLAVQTFVGSNHRPVWSRDGKYLAYASLRGTSGSRHFVFMVRSADGGDLREISPSPGIGRVDQLQWAPDSGSLILAGADVKGRYGILRVDARTGQSSVLAPKGERQNPLTLSGVSPDGKRIYYSAHTFDDNLADGTPRVIGIERDLANGTDKQIHVGNSSLGGLSPDGRYLLFRGGPASKLRVSILPSDGGETRELMAEADLGQVLAGSWTPDSSAILLFTSRHEMWLIPVSGGAPRKADLKWDPSYPEIRFVTVHPDNKRVVFQAQTVIKPTEVWVLENFLPNSKGK